MTVEVSLCFSLLSEIELNKPITSLPVSLQCELLELWSLFVYYLSVLRYKLLPYPLIIVLWLDVIKIVISDCLV